MSIVAPSGREFVADDLLSAPRLNLKCNWIGTAQEATQIGRTYPGMSIFVLTDGFGFLKDTAYRRNALDTTWIVDTAGRHRHDQDNEASGGLFSDIIYYNLHKAIWRQKGPHPGEWFTSTAVGAVITEDAVSGRLVMQTGTTINNYSAIKEAGIRLNWARPIRLIIKMWSDSNTNVTIRAGINIEHANDANSTSNMIGFECCDTVGTPRNYDVVSANGGIRSSIATTESATAALEHAYALDFIPGVSLKFSVDGVLVGTKTTHLPVTGSTAIGNLLQISIKTNEVNVDKTLRVSWAAIAGTILDPAWNIYTG